MLPKLVCDDLTLTARIDGPGATTGPRPAATAFADLRKHSTHAVLHVAGGSRSALRCSPLSACRLGGDVEGEGEVGGGEGIWGAAPGEGEALCSGEGGAGGGVASMMLPIGVAAPREREVLCGRGTQICRACNGPQAQVLHRYNNLGIEGLYRGENVAG
jgi:hypothetical protein